MSRPNCFRVRKRICFRIIRIKIKIVIVMIFLVFGERVLNLEILFRWFWRVLYNFVL